MCQAGNFTGAPVRLSSLLTDENTDASCASARQTVKPVARVSDVRTSTEFSNDLSGDEIGLKSTGEG